MANRLRGQARRWKRPAMIPLRFSSAPGLGSPPSCGARSRSPCWAGPGTETSHPCPPALGSSPAVEASQATIVLPISASLGYQMEEREAQIKAAGRPGSGKKARKNACI